MREIEDEGWRYKEGAVTVRLSFSLSLSLPLQEVFKIGMSVTASFSYFITPEASTSVCEKPPKGDANACFEVYSTTGGKISVEAFWEKREVKCKWDWGPKCSVRKRIKNYCIVLHACIYPRHHK